MCRHALALAVSVGHVAEKISDTTIVVSTSDSFGCIAAWLRLCGWCVGHGGDTCGGFGCCGTLFDSE